MPSPPEYYVLVAKVLDFEKEILNATSNEMNETSLSVEQILNLGKQLASEYLKRLRSNDLLNKILDEIFTNEPRIDWIKWLIAGGITPDEFAYEVKRYNRATICGFVWTKNHVAYRCRTCSIAPCMSLCVECFQRGHHEGHDFNMFRSQSGGACDCGDASVMHSSGFCDRHGVAKDSENIAAPPELTELTRIIAPRILFEFIMCLRNLRQDDRNVSIANNFLSMLLELCNMGSVMREVLTKALINRQQYQKFTRDWIRDDSQFAQSMSASQKLYEDALDSLKNLEPPAQFKDCTGLRKELIHNTFLEEIFFWTVKYEFPEKIVIFLVNMVPDIEYLEALTETFVMHYSRIAIMLESTLDPDPLPHRVVHLNVQLFYRKNLAVRMTDDFGILHIMVVILKHMMSKILMTPNLSTKSNGEDVLSKVVDCELPWIRESRYWPLMSDLNTILFHEPVARQFMSDDELIEMWFSFLTYFQGMNMNQRELKDHVVLESNSYIGAFLAELEACARPMWRLLSHLNNKNSIPLLKKILSHCLVSLRNWIEATNGTVDGFGENSVSFHIPLHRYLSMLVCQAVNVLHLPLSEVLPTNDLLYSIMRHPLRIQVAFYEIINGLWARNGLQIKGQVMNYLQCDFCNSMIDTDLYILQILSTRLPASDFIIDLIEKFHIKNWFNLLKKVDTSNSTNNDIDNETKMLESFLQFVATLCSIRTNLAGSLNYEFESVTYPIQTRSEIVTLLCVSDEPHSRLKELMPDRCGIEPLRHFDAVLAQIADYKAPITDLNGSLQQSLYIPKSHVWETLYDPIHVLLRVQKEDFQNSMNRFVKYVKQNNLLAEGAIPWPPYRIPSECNSFYQDPRVILQSSVFHAIIWVILYKAVHTKNLSEDVLSLAVYLLELALSMDQAEKKESSEACSQSGKNNIDVFNLELDKWFLSDRLSINLRTSVRYVISPSFQARGDSKTKPCSRDITYLSHDGSSIAQKFPLNHRNKRGKTNARASSGPKNPSSSHLEQLTANESIISMLLKLYSNFSANIDSLNPETIHLEEINNRIGDGAAFIAKVLKRIMVLDKFCREEVVQCCHRIRCQRSSRDNDKKNLEKKEESERKRIVRERRQQIIDNYAHQREEFLKKNIDEEDKMDCEKAALKEYHCVICKETSPSKPDMLMGSVVLVQPTNVLGHRRRGNDRPKLPIRDEDAANFSYQQTMVRDFQNKNRNLVDISYRQNGIHIQTCGHHLHLECLKSHLQWLKNQQQRVAVDELELIKDEYQCPLCRRLANNVIPMLPDIVESSLTSGPSISDHSGSIIKKINDLLINAECSNYLAEERPCDDISVPQPYLMGAIKKCINDMIVSTYPNLKQIHDFNRDSTMLQFISSVARSNLEIDLVQRGSSLLKPEPHSSSSIANSSSLFSKRSCIAPLLLVLAARARSLDHTLVFEIWQSLSNASFEKQHPSSDSDSSQDVPLLLRDPAELLVQLILHLPSNVDRAYVTCITRLLFNLMYFQIMALISDHLEEPERNYFRNIDSTSNTSGFVEKFSLDLCMKFTILSLDSKQDCIRTTNSKEPCRPTLELQIQELCLPFLRIACTLRHYMYGDSLPDITLQENEFQCLIDYLELSQSNLNQSPCSSASALTWSDDNFTVINSWFEQFSRYVSKHQFQTMNFASELHVSWKLPRLLELPRKYSVLFQYYHKKACSNCGQIPHKGAICLACGTLICFQQNCCKRGDINETVQHSVDCGSGTAIFLMVSSTCVVIIRGERACIWGSIYLDIFGEEDIELKRGKPLFLSEERYQLLEQQWLLHRFDHTSKKWIMHRDSL